jgi:hypothetical protein
MQALPLLLNRTLDPKIPCATERIAARGNREVRVQATHVGTAKE